MQCDGRFGSLLPFGRGHGLRRRARCFVMLFNQGLQSTYVERLCCFAILYLSLVRNLYATCTIALDLLASSGRNRSDWDSCQGSITRQDVDPIRSSDLESIPRPILEIVTNFHITAIYHLISNYHGPRSDYDFASSVHEQPCFGEQKKQCHPSQNTVVAPCSDRC